MLQVVRTGYFPVSGQRPDVNMTVVDADALEFVQPADVNQGSGTGQPQPHQGQQAVTAGQQPGIFMVAKHLNGLGHGAGLVVVKIRCVHTSSPPS